MIGDILAAIDACAANPSASVNEWLRPYRPHGPRPRHHQLLVMLKPELTASLLAADGSQLLVWILDTLAGQGVQPHAVRVMSGSHLAERRVIESHYAMLYAISTGGLAKVSDAAAARLCERFPSFADHPDRVIGGHQFLERFAGFSPRSLDVLTQNVPVTKLGAGTYAIEAEVDGERYLLLNAFHPFQIAHFTAPGSAVVLLECLSDQPLSDIRARAIGATDPRQAWPHSVRRELVDPRSPWSGRWSVCTSRNAIHASPSAVEAMFSIQRYFGPGDGPLPLEQTVLGAQLRAAGADLGQVQTLAHDPEVEVAGLSGPLFEITEDMAADDAAALVLNLLAEAKRDG